MLHTSIEHITVFSGSLCSWNQVGQTQANSDDMYVQKVGESYTVGAQTIIAQTWVTCLSFQTRG